MKYLWASVVLAILLAALGPEVGAQAKPQLTSTEPISSAATITPNNGVTFTTICRAVYIGGAGNLTIDVADGGTNIAFNGLTAGTILPVRTKRVYATGTSATALVCLY
jgi:hypothetical protein